MKLYIFCCLTTRLKNERRARGRLFEEGGFIVNFDQWVWHLFEGGAYSRRGGGGGVNSKIYGIHRQ